MGSEHPISHTANAARGGSVELPFSVLPGSDSKVRESTRRVCAIPGVPLDEAAFVAADFGKRPSVPARDIPPEASRQLAWTVAGIGRGLTAGY